MKTCPTCRVRYPDALDFCPQDGTNLAGQAGHTEVLFDRFLGTVVDGRYKIESKLGEGGMGVVYAARHVIIDKRVAIKVLKREAQTEETAGQRFIQEARSASRIGHANIVDITDFGSMPDGSAYFVMEFLDGKTLGQVLTGGPLPARKAAALAAQMARGLQAAHKNGIVHRDLKPENIFLIERDGLPDQVKIVDFGIAKVQSQSTGQRLTQAGMVLGTPEYMAPEAATGKETDHRVDEYSLGCILYEMLTGDVPFKGTNSAATLTKQVFEQVVPPRKRRPELEIPAAVEAVVLRAIAKKPDERFPSMIELLEALEVAVPDLELGGARLSRVRPVAAAPAAMALRPTVDAEAISGERPARRAMVPWLAGGAAALAVAAVVGALALGGPGRAPVAGRPDPVGASPVVASPVVAAPPAPAPAAAVPPTRAAAPTEAGAGQAPPAVAAEPLPAEVTLTLRTRPPGAAVYQGTRRLGATPLVVQKTRGTEALALTFRMHGYVDVERVFVPSVDQAVEVVLAPRSSRPARRASGQAARGAGSTRGGRSRPKKTGPATDLRDPFL